MRVGITLTYRDSAEPYIHADLLIRSIRRWMPGVHITQFTDMASPQIIGVDKVLRQKAAPLSVIRPSHFSSVEGEWLFLDSDTVIEADVRHVFDQQFDIAMAERISGSVPDEFMVEMPFNAGVIFSRNRTFWKEVYERMRKLPFVETPPHAGKIVQTDFLADQKIINQVIAEGKYVFHMLPAGYNTFPGEFISHYKGGRKVLLFQRFIQEAY